MDVTFYDKQVKPAAQEPRVDLYVRITGDSQSVVDRRAKPEDIKRFKRPYERYEEAKAEAAAAAKAEKAPAKKKADTKKKPAAKAPAKNTKSGKK